MLCVPSAEQARRCTESARQVEKVAHDDERTRARAARLGSGEVGRCRGAGRTELDGGRPLTTPDTHSPPRHSFEDTPTAARSPLRKLPPPHAPSSPVRPRSLHPPTALVDDPTLRNHVALVLFPLLPGLLRPLLRRAPLLLSPLRRLALLLGRARLERRDLRLGQLGRVVAGTRARRGARARPRAAALVPLGRVAMAARAAVPPRRRALALALAVPVLVVAAVVAVVVRVVPAAVRARRALGAAAAAVGRQRAGAAAATGARARGGAGARDGARAGGGDGGRGGRGGLGSCGTERRVCQRGRLLRAEKSAG